MTGKGQRYLLIVFDELTHFTKKMFFYMLTRNRSTSGVKPYIRATCNPDPDSWVYNLISWWIGDDGYPDPKRQGIKRYFMVDNDNYIWGSTKEEVVSKGMHALKPIMDKTNIDPRDFIKSIEFIGGSIYDNEELLSVNPTYLGNLNAQPEEVKKQLLKGNWKVSSSNKDVYNYDSFRDIFTNSHVKSGLKCITADIALKGSDKLVIFVWDGKILIDFIVLSKSNGKQVVEAIKLLAKKHGVSNSNIVFDNDGVGGFVDGFIPNAKEFKNGGRPVRVRGSEPNYPNLKTQCYYLSGDSVANGDYYVLPDVANRMYDDKDTLKDRFLFERKAIKKAKTDHDGKLRINDKSEQKAYLDGESPDLMDAFMEREFLGISKTTTKF